MLFRSDVSIQGEALNLLADVQRTLGLAVVVITHNLNIVRHVADRMAIMYLGRFIEEGPTAEVMQHPRHPYTGALLAANPSIDAGAAAERVVLSGEVPSLLHRPNGCEFHTRCSRVQPDCRITLPTLEAGENQHAWRCRYPLG